MKLCRSFDIGGTWTKGAVVNARGEVSQRIRFPTPSREPPAALIDSIIGHARGLDVPSGTACCISVAGIVNVAEGIVAQSPNLPLWKNVRLRNNLSKRLKTAVHIENDANCALLAESWLGAARGFKDAVMLTLGTGVGGACITGGRLVRGRSGYAAEFGHITVRAGGRRCSCGGKGHLESYCSIKALAVGAAGCLPAIAGISGGDIPLRLEDLARAGNKAAVKIWDKYGFYLGAAVASLLNALNPEAVILGGGISRAFGLFKGAMVSSMNKSAYAEVVADARIKTARFADDAGIIGAASPALSTGNQKS